MYVHAQAEPSDAARPPGAVGKRALSRSRSPSPETRLRSPSAERVVPEGAAEQEKRATRVARFAEPTVDMVNAGTWLPARPPTPQALLATVPRDLRAISGRSGPSPRALLTISSEHDQPARPAGESSPPALADAAASGVLRTVASRSPSPQRGGTIRAPSLRAVSTAMLALGPAVGSAQTLSSSAVTLEGQPPRFANEVTWPLPDGYSFPEFQRIAFHEHSGSFREAWAERGFLSASVCRRPTMREPSENSTHYIMEVEQFLQVYPHGIEFSTSHVDCGSANWATHAYWAKRVADGSMLQSAEEILSMLALGRRAAAEQAPTAHESLLGAPAFKINACDLGGINLKNLWWWCRGVTTVEPADVTPAADRVDAKASASGSPEQKMVQRSFIEPAVAGHLIDAWEAQIKASPPTTSPAPRASEPAPELRVWRGVLLHNYTIFAARYVPTLPLPLQEGEGARRHVLLYCTAPSPLGLVFLVPTAQAVHGAPFDVLKPLEAQAAELAVCFYADAKPQMACCCPRAPKHFLGAVPRAEAPLEVATSPTEFAAAAAAGCEHVWCTQSALSESRHYLHVSLIARRASSRREAVPFMVQGTGAWEAPRPVVKRRAAFAWNHSGATGPEAAASWQAFLERERSLKEELQRAISACDRGDGALHAIAAGVTTAADLEAELIPPEQGLPTFSTPNLLLKDMPERPPPLITAWLTRLPAQRVPAGAEHAISWRSVLRPWARKMICSSLNRTADHDFMAWDTGVSTSRRPKFLCLGGGAFYEVPHADGIGTYNQSIVIRKRRADGLLVPLDFDAEYQDHKKLDFIKSQLGNITDKELLSFLFGGGTSWKMTQADGSGPPHQIRIAHNLDSLPERIKGVSRATAKLVKAGRYEVVKIRRRHEQLSPDSDMCPMMYMPQFSVGVGGTDKHDSEEKRKVGDATAPHNLERERNSPHGEPDGPPVVSANEMTGPSKLPPGYDGPPVPFPDPEIKHRPSHLYCAAAVLLHLCSLVGFMLSSSSSDIRWCFFQFFTRVSEYWLQVFYLIIEILDEKLGTVEEWFCSVGEKVMNMGSRPASKIATRFNEEWSDVWRRLMDDIVAAWLPRQPKRLIDALAERSRVLGKKQARPFFADLYTDDNVKLYISCPEHTLMSKGIQLETDLNRQANIWMSGYQAGTIPDWIGARFVLNGGFGTVKPSKRARGVLDCSLAIAEQITNERLEVNNSFCVHLDDVLDFPKGTRRGMWGPLKGPFVKAATAKMTAAAKTANAAVIVQLATRPCASFLCAVDDAPKPDAECRRLWLHLASDAAFRIAPPRVPHIFGAAPGVCWRWPLTGEWSRRHVTLTEACGRALNEIVVGPLFAQFELLFESDNTMALAVGQGTERASDAQYVAWRKQQEPTYADVAERSWDVHTAGSMNTVTDVGSRDRQDVLDQICAAFDFKMTEIDLQCHEPAQKFMADVLANTSPYDPPLDSRAGRYDQDDGPLVSGHRHIAADDMAPNLPPAAFPPRSTYGKEAEEAIQYLPLHDVTPPHAPRLAFRGDASRSEAASSPPPSSPGPSWPPDPPGPSVPSTHAAPCTPEPLASTRLAMPRRSPRSPADVDRLQTGSLPVNQLAAPSSGPKAVASSPEAVVSRGSANRAEELRRQRSPQPANAKAARRRAAAEMADTLAADESPYALFPDDAGMLRAAVSETHKAIARGKAHGTEKRDDWGYGWVAKFCEATGNAVMRPRDPPPSEQPREAYFAAFAIMWIALFMLPSARRRARGFLDAMPSSSLAAIYGWRAVQGECHRWLPDMVLVGKALKGLNEEYKQRWGQDALVPERTEPIPLWALKLMVDTLVAAKLLDGVTNRCYLVMLCFGIVAAPRLDELCEMFPSDTYFTRSNFAWFDGDTQVIPTLANLRALRCGVFLRARSAPSKADRMNTEWGGRDMWFRVDDSNQLGFAHRFLEWEIDHFCPPDLRSKWPAFSLGGTDKPLKPGPVREWHKKVATHVMGAERAKLRTWHALRATLASAIAAYRNSDGKPLENYEGIAQMLVRWKSLDSLRIYLKVKATDYADYADIVTRTDGTAISQGDLPPLGPESAIADLDAAVAALSKKQKGQAALPEPEGAAADDGPAPARKQQRREPATPRPQLLGTRVRVLWEDEWYHGVAGASRLEDGVWITRVAYDASGTWRKCSMWHSLANETWEQM